MISLLLQLLPACSRERATQVLTRYRGAIAASDFASAARCKAEFAGYTAKARQAALAAVYPDVMPSHRPAYAFGDSSRAFIVVARDATACS
jgi:ubiquinone biosynthesis protein UbiJ